jgi:hypothetical protein
MLQDVGTLILFDFIDMGHGGSRQGRKMVTFGSEIERPHFNLSGSPPEAANIIFIFK